MKIVLETDSIEVSRDEGWTVVCIADRTPQNGQRSLFPIRGERTGLVLVGLARQVIQANPACTFKDVRAVVEAAMWRAKKCS